MGQNIKLAIKFIGEDDWSREVYQNIKNKRIYKKVDDQLYSSTPYGEPDCPLRDDLEIIIVNKNMYTNGQMEYIEISL